MRLFEIADEIEKILAIQVDQDTGEIGDEAIAALQALEMQRDEKMLAIAAYLKGERAEGDAVQDQAKQLSARARAHHARAARLEDLIAQTLVPGEKLSDARSALSWRRSEAVEILDEKMLPSEFVRVKTEPDKTAIKEALKEGASVPGAKLTARMNLQVK